MRAQVLRALKNVLFWLDKLDVSPEDQAAIFLALARKVQRPPAGRVLKSRLR